MLKISCWVSEYPEEKVATFLESKLYQEQKENERRQAGESQVGEAMPATQSQAASSGQQPGQSSSSTTIEAEIEKVVTVAEEQWKEKKDVLSRKTAEWVMKRSQEQKDVELVVSAIGEETDSRNISSNQPPADTPDERPVSAVAPQVALLAIKAACEKRGCPTEVGQVSLYPPVFKKKPELTEAQIAAMREPNPELPRDLEEFRRVTANAQDEFSA